MQLSKVLPWLFGAANLLGHSRALDVDVDNNKSLMNVSEIVKENLMVYYQPNMPGQIPGLMTNQYYWWECGALMGTLIQYWKYSGNSTLNAEIQQALLWQMGDDHDYRPKNWSIQLGNDDQVFWGFAVMDAAELGFPEPPESSGVSWLGLAQAVFNTQAASWDDKTCNGGLRWQIPIVNPGYDYKNTISTGGFFQLAARLAYYTGNDTYADWANKSFSWLMHTPLIEDDGDRYTIWDGAHVETNCTDTVQYQWTYNPGTLLMGAAYLYNYTNGSHYWHDQVTKLLRSSEIFFVKELGANPNNSAMPQQGGQILTELTCETTDPPTCNKDQPAFKGFLARWMAMTTQLAPFTRSTVWPLLQGTAKAAARVCTGQAQSMELGTVCGRRWYQDHWDGLFGAGEQMSALSVFQNLMIDTVPPPLTLRKGGNSRSDPGAGGNDPYSGGGPNNANGYAGGNGGEIEGPAASIDLLVRPMTGGDRFGAAILTIFALLLLLAGAVWMSLTDGGADAEGSLREDSRAMLVDARDGCVQAGRRTLQRLDDLWLWARDLTAADVRRGVEHSWEKTRAQMASSGRSFSDKADGAWQQARGNMTHGGRQLAGRLADRMSEKPLPRVMSERPARAPDVRRSLSRTMSRTMDQARDRINREQMRDTVDQAWQRVRHSAGDANCLR